MIRTKGLTKRFGETLAVDGLDLEVVPALGAADYALVGVGARLFQREAILTRWR